MKVYAKVGETLYLGSSAVGIDAGSIRAISPNNVTYNNPVGRGLIANRSQELFGPSLNNGVDDGYVPFTHTVLTGEEGVWEIYFYSPGEDPNDGNNNTLQQPGRINANDPWTQMDDTDFIYAFDVSVRNTANTMFLKGRAFMNVFGGSLGDWRGEFRAVFKVLTNDGYQYEVNNNGQAGYQFVFFSNNKGFRDASGAALYRSINTTFNPNIHDPRTADNTTNITHKIFFNTPSSDLPTSAPSPSGNTWLLTQPTSPVVSNFLFKGKEGTDNQAGTYPLGGYITFDINMSGSYILQIDVDQDGSFDDAVDVRMFGTATVGDNEIYWDGLNGQGNPVAGGFTFNPGDLKVSLIGGEVHFPFLDVESNAYGIILTRLNGTGAPDDVVYWDDTGIDTGPGKRASNPVKTGINGVSSTANGHKWGFGNGGQNDFGDEKGLDTWSYVVSTPTIPYQSVYLKQADLEIQSITSNQSSYCVGENIVYTVNVKNNGPDNVQGAKFRLDFPSGFTVSSVSPAASGGTATLSGGNISATSYTADLDMQNQSVLTLTITGSVTAYPASGTLVSKASIMRPADVNDPDATNADNLPPTDPEAECNSGTAGCNNIKSSTSVNITRVNISISGNGVTEGSGGGTTNITFPVALSAASQCPITVDYVLSHVAADPAKPVTNALDFSGSTSGTLLIPANQTSATITIPVAADRIVEANETFTITLSNASGDNVIAIPSAEGFITNDDQAVITSTKADANEQGAVDGRYTFSFPSGYTADKDVTIQYNLAGTAQGGGTDYTDALSGSVVIPAGSSSASVTIDVNDDDVVEGTETVILNVTNLLSDYSGLNGNQITLNNTASQLNIFDNDETTLTITPSVTKNEGNSGTTAYTFTLTLNKATGSGFTINYNTTNATASAADGDFGAAGATLNFSGTAGETKDITILVSGDTKIEGNETFYVDLTALSSNFSNRLTVPLSRASGNITNDDNANLSMSATDGAEGGSDAAFLFSLENGLTVDEDVTIYYTLSNGTASVNTDYTGSLTGSVILPANQNSTTLSLPVVDDNLIEGDETLSLTINSIVSSYGVVATNSPQSLTITDNDFGTVEITANSITEGNTGTKTLNFTVSVTGQTQSTFTIPYTTLDGTALAGEDYVGVATPVNISFDNTANPSRQIAITINSDRKIEADEIFQVVLGALSKDFGGHLSITTGRANGTILNDDSSNISIIPANGSETGPAAASFTFKLADGFTADADIQIAYSLGGSADNGVDYTGSATTGTVTIPAGQNSTLLTLPVVNDDILENTESIVIIAGPSAVTSPYGITVSNSPQQANITDNDEAYISILGPAQVQEGNGGATQPLTYTLTLDKATKRAFSVDFTTQDGTAKTSDNDYLANSGQLSFSGTAGETRQIQVVVNGDYKIEPDENLSVLISNLSDNFGGKLQFANTSSSSIIKNDDSGSITVTTQDGAEGGDPVSFTFSLPANVTVDEDIIIPYSINGSTGDLTGATSGNVTIAAGQNSVELILPVIDDTIIEGAEAVTLELSSPSNSYNIQLQNGTTHTANIADNDTGTIEILDASITEGDNGSQLMNFQVRLNGDTEGGFTIPYSTSNGTALSAEDYVAAASSATVSFAGSLNEVRTISVAINGDLRIEANETFQVLLGTPSNLFGGQLSVIRSSATGTINNNDGGQVTIDPTTAYEEGTVAGTFNFHLPTGYTADAPIQITYNLGGTASNGVDYSGSGLSGSVTIPAGQNSIVLTLPVVDDNLVEGAEQVILSPVSITSAHSSITLDGTTKTFTIEDNDQAELILSGPAAVNEGADGTSQTVTFTVTLNKATQAPFSVPYTFSDGNANLSDNDYAATSGSLSFTGTTAGESRTITATINGDGKIEADENFFLNLGSPDKTFGNRLTVPVSQAEARILNDDSGNISISAANGAEAGAVGNFTFSLPAGVVVDKDVTIFYNYTGGTATNADYTASPSGLSVTIPAGQNSTSIQITVTDDQVVEGDETLVLNATSISADYGISLPAVSTVSLTIADNDNAQLIASAPVAVIEGNNGTTGYTFNVKLDKQTAQAFTVDFATQNGSAIAGEDYQAQSATLNFNGAQDEQRSVTVLVNGDRKIEADELFNFLLSNLSRTFGGRLTIATPSVSGTITNDDSALIRISKTDGAEGGANAKYTFTFENGVTSDQPVTLTYTLAGSAGAGDYSASQPTSLTIPANTNSAEILFTIVDDAIVEPTETISFNALALQPTYAGVSLDAARPTINILDNDQARLVISGPPQVIESNSGINEVVYTVTLQGNTQGAFSVDYEVQEQTAHTADNDFSFNPGTLNFTGFNNEAKTFSLFVNGDNMIEPSEYLYLVLTGLSNPFNGSLVIDNSPYQVDIVNDDGDDISISHVDAVEGQSDGKFVFSLPGGVTVAGDIAITYTLGGTAVSGTDHSALTSGTVILPAGQSSVELPIPVLNDDIVELTETVSISASTSNAFSVALNNDTDVLQVRDTDTGTISVASVAIDEKNSGQTNLTFDLILDKETSQTFSVSYNTQDGTATAGEDYQAAISNASVTFDGDANESSQVSISVNGDLKIENDEYFDLLLTAISEDFEGRLTFANSQATGTINNDDNGEISITKVDGAEGNPTSPSFRFSFPTGVFADQPTTINFTLNGTASTLTGVDYTASPSANSITIPAGSSEATLTFAVNDDNVIELTETISFASINYNSPYTDVSLSTDRPVISITDNDTGTLTLTGPNEQLEGQNGTTKLTYTLTLDKATTAPFSIPYKTSNGTATTADSDYQASAGVFDFLGKANESFQFDVFIRGDLKMEADEIFNVVLEAVSTNFDNRLSVTGSPLAVTIKNDDVSQIFITKQDGTEGGAEASYTFSLPQGVTADENLSITYTLTGSAEGAKDYTHAAATLTIPAGANSVSLPITVVDDQVVEDVETIVLHAVVAANGRQVTLNNNDVTANIFDNDEALVSIANLSITEGNNSSTTMSFEVKLNKATRSPFTLSYVTDNGTASAGEDYVGVSNGVLSFTGEAPQSRFVAITVNGDQKIEADETFRVVLGAFNESFNGRLKLDPAARAALGIIQNDDSAQITITPADGSENGTPGRYRFAYPANITADVPVTFNFSLAGTALQPQDYTVPNSGSITIPANAPYADVVFNIVDDAIAEGPEEIRMENLVITSPYSGITFNPVFAEVKVEDNDVARLEIDGPANIVEGHDGVTYASFQVKLTAAVAEGFEITYQTQDGQATAADNDYLPDAGRLVFAGNKDETKTINIAILGDQKIERNEDFSLLLSNLTKDFSGRLTYVSSASTTIMNDDQALISISGFDGEESAANDKPVIFRLSLEPGVTADEDIRITYTLGGVASNSADYTGSSISSVIIPQNSNYVDLILPVTDDAIIEGSETVEFTENGAISNYPVSFQQSKASQFIIDNDMATLILSPPVASNEGDSGDQLFTFTLTLNRQTATPFSISYATVDGTAKAGEDFENKSEVINFNGNSANEQKTITIKVKGDRKVEANEDFFLSLGSPSPDFINRLEVQGSPARAVILNDDNYNISLSASDGNEQGALPGTFVFKLPDGVTLDQPAVINYSLTGTAQKDADYTGSGLTGSLTLNAGENQKVLTIPVIDDNIVEGTEDVSLRVTSVQSAYGLQVNNSPATLRILDNDKATISISGPINITEGDAGIQTITFEVSLDKAVAKSFTIDYRSEDATALTTDDDYQQTAGTLVFNGSQGEKQNINVVVNGDSKIETDEHFLIRLQNLDGEISSLINYPSTPARGNILDDDNKSENRNITITKIDGEEGLNNAAFTFAFPSGITFDSETRITFALDGTAAAAIDFDQVANNVVIPAGANSATLHLNVIDDDVVEDVETVQLQTSTVSNVKYADIRITNPQVSLNIGDNDRGQIQVANALISEGDNGTSLLEFVLLSDKAASRPFLVKFETADKTATVSDQDYVNGNSSVAFEGRENEQQTIRITVNGDTKLEGDETLDLILTEITDTFNGRLTLISDRAEGTILNDDQAIIDVVAGNGREGGNAATFTFSYQNGVVSDEALQILYQLEGTANGNGVDYSGPIAGSVVIQPGQSSTTLTLPVIDDNLLEGDEDIELRVVGINSPYQGLISLSTTNALAQILDNDEASLRISGPVEVVEGNSGSRLALFNITLNRATGRSFSVKYATNDGSAKTADNDYLSTGGTLNFGGNSSETRQVSVQVNGDVTIEPDEDFFISLFDLSDDFNGNLQIEASPARGIIKDDDNTAANKMITIAPVQGTEDGAPAQFVFSFPAGVVNSSATHIPYALAGTAGASDYNGLLSGTVIIPAGRNSATLSLPIIDDNIIEGDELIRISTGDVSNAEFSGIQVTNSPQDAKILDNDRARISMANISISEGNVGQQEAIFEVRLDKATGSPFTVAYATADQTASLADGDYVAASANLNFLGKADEIQQIKVKINGDRKIEANERINMLLQSISNSFGGRLTFQNSSATATILNDDVAQISVSKQNGAEQGQVPVSFSFSLPSGMTSDMPVSIQYNLTGSATSGGTDYVSASSGSIVLPANRESVLLSLPVVDDEIIEDDEAVILTISSLTTPYLSSLSFTGRPDTALIADNDVTVLGLSPAVEKEEGNNGTTRFDYTITLEKATGKSFTLNYTTLDGTAQVQDNDYVQNSGVLSFSGTAGESQTISVLVNGDMKIEANENFSFSISDLSNDFNNRLAIPVSSVAGTVRNDDNAAITISKIDGTEGSQNGRFEFALPPSVTSDRDIIINYRLTGTASTSDYIASPSASSITLPAGQNKVSLDLLITDDAVLEERENIVLNVSQIINPYNNVTLVSPVPIVDVFDNDLANLTIINPSAISEGQSGTKTVDFRIQLDKTTDKPFSVKYTTADITATTSDNDYQAKAATLNFTGVAGETKVVSITTNSDVKIENNEDFGLKLLDLNPLFDGKLILGIDGKATLLNDDIAPVANNDVLITPEDTPITASLIDNDTHAEGIDPASIVLASQASKGTLLVNTDGTVTFTPQENAFGTDMFSYTVKDIWGRVSNVATVNLTIVAVNDPPVANDDVFYVQKDSSIRANVGMNDVDVDEDVLGFTLKDNVQHGTIDMFDISDGSFIYTPEKGFKGEDLFTYIVKDPAGLSDTASVTLYVQPKVTVSLSPEVTILTEGDSVVVTAKISESLFQDVNIVLNFEGTAESGKDYQLSGNYDTILIPAGDTVTTQRFKFEALKDYLKEGDENVTIQIIAVDPAAFVIIGNGADILIRDFYPEGQEEGPGENGNINPDPYMSPNNDGLGNEHFVIYNIEQFVDNEVFIYNRWGNEVYHTRGYDNKDNVFTGQANKGVLSQGGAPLVDGVYYYVIYTKVNGERKLNKGYVIIRR